MKGLKLWQAILLIFGCICVASGGVVLYTYLTTGFGGTKIEAENILFKTDDALYNGNLNQFEVDSNFSLVINATNEGVTENDVTLSFADKSSNETLSNEKVFVRNGVNYITNGIVAVPQVVKLGVAFEVIIEQKEYEYDGVQKFVANVGGLTTIHAKSTNKLDSVGANITVAVDVPVKAIKLQVKDSTNGREYSITDNSVKILQNTNFDITVNYYPASSRYRYSDNLYMNYKNADSYDMRVKDYCFEISAGNDVQKFYNNGDVFFTTSANLTTGNKISIYVFSTAKKQAEFEALGTTGTGEVYYNAMLSYLAQSESDVLKQELTCNITQADVGNMFILNTTFDAKTNRLFTLTANNKDLGNGSLGLSIADTEGASLSSMISQAAIRVSYKKAGETEFTELSANDKTVVIKSVDRTIVGTSMQNNPYEYNGSLYFFPTTNIKNLNNAYWEISTSESAVQIKLDVVLFKTQDYVTSIFDENGDRLTGALTRTAFINVTENPEDEGDVAWTGNSTENLSIVYNGDVQVPSQIDLSSKTSVPNTNTYQRVKYFIIKNFDGDGNVVEGGKVEATDANINGKTMVIGGVTYYEVESSDLLFRGAGTYTVLFATIKTDAYGNILYDGESYQIAKLSSSITIVVTETLQSFNQTSLVIQNPTENGVFVKTRDTSKVDGKTYYKYDPKTMTYSVAETFNVEAIREYFELSYYAVKTGAQNTLALNIEVAESTTKMLNDEIAKDNLKFYIVSADGEIEMRVTTETRVDTSWTQSNEGGTAVELANRISFYLQLPSTSVVTANGLGKGFYVVARYFNTIEYIDTKIFVDDFGRTIEVDNNGQKEYFNCFMLYTPDAQTIKNSVLEDMNFDIAVEMNRVAEYETCTLSYYKYNEELGDMEQITVDDGKAYLNDNLKKTIVLDAYGRKFGEQGKNYDVRTGIGASAVYIVNKEIEFASGTETAEIIVSAGNKDYRFKLNTKSYGLSKVAIGGVEFDQFNNISTTLNASKGSEYSLKVDVFVGKNGDTALNEKYFYLKDIETNEELLEMFTFYGGDNNIIAKENITSTTPITKILLNENFAQSASLTFIVSNKDYENKPEVKETVRFEMTYNFPAQIIASVNFNDAAGATTTENVISDGIYAGYGYDLDKLISLKYGNNEVSWWFKNNQSGSKYSGGTWYINAEGNVTTEGSAENSIGQISNDCIMFYDVATTTSYPLKLYFYNNNNYAYHCELNVKVVPNLKLSPTNITELNIIELEKESNGLISAKYVTLERVRGNAEISNVFITVLDGDMPIIYENGGVFKFEAGEVLKYNYDEYSRVLNLGLKLGEETVYDKDGNTVEYNGVKVVVKNRAENEIKNNVKYGDSLKDFLNNILKNNNDFVTTTFNDGILSLEVNANVNYLVNDAKIAFTDTSMNDISSGANTENSQLYKNVSGGIMFYPIEQGFAFGNTSYLVVLIKNGSGEIIVSLKVPVYVSSVGDVYAFYKDYFTNVEGKYKNGDNFDLQTLLYGDENGFPYATMTAGQQVQIAFNGARTFDQNKKFYYYNFDKEGIYYNEDFAVDLTFEDGSKLNKYARILQDASGRYFLHIANLSGEKQLLIINVRLESGSSHLNYTYRIMLEPNVITETTYPLASGENAAEYVSIINDTTYNLADVFGSFAGDKANETRFATKIMVKNGDSETEIVYDSNSKYYFIRDDAKVLIKEDENAKDQYILEAGKTIYYYTGTEMQEKGTILSSLILYAIDETEDVGEKTYARLNIANENYLIKEIEVGGNANASGQGIVFTNFVTSGTSTERDETSSVEYSVEYLIDGNTRRFALKANSTLIANISLTTAGVLEISNINRDYYINLVITKEISNVVNGNLDYNFFINNERGTTYIEYVDKDGNSFEYVDEDYTKAQADLVSNTSYSLTLYTKYTTGSGTSMTEIALDEPNFALYSYESGTKTEIANNGTITGLELKNNSAGNYTLTFTTKEFIDRDYVVEFYFKSGAKTISTLYATLNCSVTVARKGDDIDKTGICGGQTISAAWAQAHFTFTSGAEPVIDVTQYVTGVEVVTVDENNIIKANGEISSLITEAKDVTIYVKFVANGYTFYRSLTFDVKPNITVELSVDKRTEKYYANETTISVPVTDFYALTGALNGTLTPSVEVPLTYKQYIESAGIAGGNVVIKTQNVSTKISNVQINVHYSYSNNAGYEFTFKSILIFDIEPNVEMEVNYPAPTEEDELENESVYFGEKYPDFFNTTPPFAKDKSLSRVVVLKSSENNIEKKQIAKEDLENAKVWVSEIYGMEIYAKVKNPKAGDFENYYVLIKDENFEYFEYAGLNGGAFSTSTDYFYKFDPTSHSQELTGFDQMLYFKQYGAYADGYATFRVSYNEVVTEYKIHAFEKIVDMEIVNSVNSMNGVEEIFLDQLTEGNILAQNAVARLSMGTLASGTYYIKISNFGNVANPYHWIGFKYNANGGNLIHVLLGETAKYYEVNGNIVFGDDTAPRGCIIGLYSSRSGGEEIISLGGATLELRSFINMSYRYFDGTRVQNLEIEDEYIYTNLIEKQINGERKNDLTLVFKHDGKWKTYNADGSMKEVSLTDADLVQYIYGKYEVYNGYVVIGENKTYISEFKEKIDKDKNGFGKVLTKVENGKIGNDNDGEQELYKFVDSKNETVYVKASDATTYYQTSQGYAFEYKDGGESLNTKDPDGKKKVENVSGFDLSKDYTSFDFGGYRYYVTKQNTELKPISVYQALKSNWDDSWVVKFATAGYTLTKVNDNDEAESFKVFTAENDGDMFLNNSINGTGYYSVKKVTNTNFNYFTLYTHDETEGKYVLATEYISSETYYINVVSTATDIGSNVFKIESANGNFYVVKGATKIYKEPTVTAYRIFGKYFASSLNKVSVSNTEKEKKYLKDVTIVDNTIYKIADGEYNYITKTQPEYNFENNNVLWTARVNTKATSLDGIIFRNDTTHSEILSYINSVSDKVIMFKTATGVQYIIEAENVDAANITKVMLLNEGTDKTVYRAKTKEDRVNTATMVSSTKETDDYYYIAGQNIYIKKSDVVTYRIKDDSTLYEMSNLQDFNIGQVKGLVIGTDIAKVKFNYIIGEKIGDFEFEFKLKLDVDVQNSISSDAVSSYVKQVENDDGVVLNYIEIETNKEYNFNDLVRVIKPSSGEIIEKQDVRSTTNVSIEIIGNDIAGIKDLDNDVKAALMKLGGNLKTNETEVIRLSYEIVKTDSSSNGIVYNFNLTPLGADNDGDFVLVKYTYEVGVEDFVWKDRTLTKYSQSTYILFKILPDYNVTMKDTTGAPIVVINGENSKGGVVTGNEINPVLIDNFDAVGFVYTGDDKTDDFKLKNLLGISSLEADTNNGIGVVDDGKGGKTTYITIDKTVWSNGKLMVEEKKDATAPGYRVLSVTDKSGNVNTYYISENYNYQNDENKIELEHKLGKNYLLDVTGSGTSSSNMLKVTAKNAVNALRDISASNFEATITATGDTTAKNDVEKYLYSLNKWKVESDKYKIEKGTETKLGVNDVVIGQRDYLITLKDNYGYIIEFYFSLLAPSNPTYAAGSLEFIEGKTFDIGAQYDLVSVTEYNVDGIIFYPVELNSNTAKNYTNIFTTEKPNGITAPTTDPDLKLVSGNGDNIKASYVYTGKDSQTLQNAYKYNETTALYKITATDVKESTATYYIALTSDQTLTTTQGVNTLYNLPSGRNKTTTETVGEKTYYYSIMCIGKDSGGKDAFIKIDSNMLKVSSTGYNITVESPEETNDIKDTYMDTIELAGVNAFGYKTPEETAINPAGKYFKSETALDKMTVTSVKYCYKDADGNMKDLIEGVKPKLHTLASSGSAYKYGSTNVIGRKISQDNYTVPEMPGWIYAEKDYAYVYMVISLSYGNENYSLPIEIKVTKQDKRLIEDKMGATNVSDNVEFELSNHFSTETNENKVTKPNNFYDDTLAITLPQSPAKVKVDVTATNGSDTRTGSVTVSADYVNMDSTHYLSLSNIVGRTLGKDWTVNVKFSEYDLSRVTRNGNFGFYATYNEGTPVVMTPSEQNSFDVEKTISYVYGYGKIANVNAESRLTMARVDGVDGVIIVPTEKIDTTGAQPKISANTNYIGIKTQNNDGLYEIPTDVETVKTELTNYDTSIAIENDKLHLVDMGALTNGYQSVTKYYIVEYIEGEKSNFYQYVKSYRLYPTYFGAETSDINNRVEANMSSNAGDYYSFNLTDGWGKEVSLKKYGLENTSSPLSGDTLNSVDKSKFYFELGDKNTTSASIDKDGVLRVKKSEYTKLDGSEYVTINLYIKASGELGEYTNDNLPYSGNTLNKPLITIKIYLKGTPDDSFKATLEKVAKLESLANEWKASNTTTYTVRQLAIMYIRTGKYNSSQWNGLAGTLPTGFETYVNDNKNFVGKNGATYDVTSLRSLATISPNSDVDKIDFVHLIATINMYDEGITPSSIYKQAYDANLFNKTNIADLGGWAGDIADLVKDIKDEVGDYAALLSKATALMGISGGFGHDDFLADVDASNIYKSLLKNDSSMTLAKALENYYSSTYAGVSYKNRVATFAVNEPIGTATEVQTRLIGNMLMNYSAMGIQGLFQSYGIDTTTHANHIKAACEAFVNFINANK